MSKPDTSTAHTPEGPVQGELARRLEALKNACNALGPLNFLPDRASEADLALLDQATVVVSRFLRR